MRARGSRRGRHELRRDPALLRLGAGSPLDDAAAAAGGGTATGAGAGGTATGATGTCTTGGGAAGGAIVASFAPSAAAGGAAGGAAARRMHSGHLSCGSGVPRAPFSRRTREQYPSVEATTRPAASGSHARSERGGEVDAARDEEGLGRLRVVQQHRVERRHRPHYTVRQRHPPTPPALALGRALALGAVVGGRAELEEEGQQRVTTTGFDGLGRWAHGVESAPRAKT